MRKSRKSRAVESNAAETPIPAAAPNTIMPAPLESAPLESASPLNQAATKTTPPLARVGDSQPTARKKSCCHRPGCYVFGDNYFSALATITIPFDEVQESSVFESVVVVGDPLWARFAASKR